MYNLENVTDNVTGLLPIVQGLNVESEGVLGVALLILTFLSILIMTKQYEGDLINALLTSSFITTFVGILFWAIKLITWQILLFPIILLFASIIIKQFNS